MKRTKQEKAAKNKKVFKALNVIAQTLTQTPVIHAYCVPVRMYAEIGGDTFTTDAKIYYSDSLPITELFGGKNLLHSFEFNYLLNFCVKNGFQLTITY